MYKSHRQQVLANYFDGHLVRTRDSSVSIDAQLINIGACALDDAYLRYRREIAALQLPYCPTGLDNNGVYYAVSLDSNYVLASDATELNSVIGIRAGVSYNLSVYNDILPIPAGYKKDVSRVNTQIVNPIICSFAGLGNTQLEQYQTLVQIPNVTLPITNRLSFWVANTNQPNILIDIAITGVKYPQSPWGNSNTQDIETIQISSEGYSETINAWISISKIVVRNLPAGGSIDCYSINFNLPAVLDNPRPVTIPTIRDVVFPRYWQISPTENQLQELYYLDNLSKLVYYQSYNLSQNVVAVAMEPNTWGGVAGGGTKLYYFDKREPMTGLAKTGLKVEPCYGLDVFYDVSFPGPIRNVLINPIPYKNAGITVQNRIVVIAPDHSQNVLLPDGSYITNGSGVGWQTGAPETMSIPLNQTGLYIFRLECLDQTGKVTHDIFPYNNFDITTLIKDTFDLSSIAINIESVCYDFLGNLWIFDGTWAIPISPFYNGYVLDPVGRTIYLTDEWDQITYE